MTMRVMVCDDELLARKRLTRLLEAMGDVEFAGAYESADALIDALAAAHDAGNPADCVLLDIHMPNLTGIDAAGLLPEPRPAVVFCTAHKDHALEAFDKGAVDYVMKPIDADRLKTALERVRARTGTPAPSSSGEAKLALSTHKGVVFVDKGAVEYAVLEGELVLLRAGGTEHLTEFSLSDLEDKLDGFGLVRVHRRALIHLDAVDVLEPVGSGGYTARMKDGRLISVSRQAARGLRRRFDL